MTDLLKNFNPLGLRLRPITWLLLWVLIALSPLSNVTLAKAESKKQEHGSSKTSKKKQKVAPEPAKSESPKEPDLGKGKYDALGLELAKLDAVLVLDASRSMQRTDPRRLRDQAAKLFLRFLSPSDRVSIVQFDREARQVVSFTDVNPGTIAALDKIIDEVPTDGGFTDIESGLSEAFRIAKEEARPEARKTVVLFSDGKMDPHPSRGTGAELTSKTTEELLPRYVDLDVNLYTVALSEESDKELLADFAKRTNGLSWYATDPSTIHKRFSELFLNLKRPQVVPLEATGFEVDSSVREATFYISRQKDTRPIILVDPKGDEINSSNIPPDVKWFTGELFDVITVQRPLAGRWKVKGQDSSEGFATLLSNVNFQVRWPKSTYKLGEQVLVGVRLLNEGKELQGTGLEEITFYSCKIINADNGNLVLSVDLNDKGENGDIEADDGIFSTMLKFEQEGNFQAFFSVTSPTFTRQQRISFSVNSGLINIKLVPADEFTGTEESVQVTLNKITANYKSRKVKVEAEPILSQKSESKDKAHESASESHGEHEGEEVSEHGTEASADTHSEDSTIESENHDAEDSNPKQKAPHHEPVGKHEVLTLEPSEKDPLVYSVPTEELYNGRYHLIAKLTALDGKKPVEAESDPLEINVTNGRVEEHHHEEPSKPLNYDLIVGIACTILSIAWLWWLRRWSAVLLNSKRSNVAVRHAYVIPETLQARLEELRALDRSNRRRANDGDRAVFALVASVLDSEEASLGTNKPQKAETEKEVEESGEEQQAG